MNYHSNSLEREESSSEEEWEFPERSSRWEFSWIVEMKEEILIGPHQPNRRQHVCKRRHVGDDGQFANEYEKSNGNCDEEDPYTHVECCK